MRKFNNLYIKEWIWYIIQWIYLPFYNYVRHIKNIIKEIYKFKKRKRK